MKKNEYEIIRQKMIIKKNGKNKDDFHYLKEICHWEKKLLLNIHTRIITFNDTYLLLLDSKKNQSLRKKNLKNNEKW